MTAEHQNTRRHSFLWECSYPNGIIWDKPFELSSLGQYLNRSVARYPHRTAVIYRNSDVKYRDLGDYVLRVASSLLGMPSASSGIALLLPNTIYHSIMLFGAWSAGLRVVQLSPLDAIKELEFKLQNSGARVLITLTESPFLEYANYLRTAGLLDEIIALDDNWWEGETNNVDTMQSGAGFFQLLSNGKLRAPLVLDIEDLAILQYTGGTTGRPKGAALTHKNLVAAAEMAAYWQSVRGEDVHDHVIMVLPLFHAFALTMMNRHLGHGNSILLRRKFDPSQCLDDIESFKGTTINCVPTMWIAMADHPALTEKDLSSLTYATSGGAPLPGEVANKLMRDVNLRIFPGWGMTEAAAIGTQHCATGEIRPGSIGMPLPGLELQVVSLDDPSRILPAGETGEIAIRGPNLFQGYWKNTSESSVFINGFFMTGDVGRIDEDGFVYLTDRKKDMILSSGYNVYPRNIEEAIYAHPAIAECIVIGIPDPYRGQAAKAYVALKPGYKCLTLDALHTFLKDKIGRHEMPTALEVRDHLPRTSVGKFSRALL